MESTEFTAPKSVISIRFDDGEEVFHRDKIADDLYNSYLKKEEDFSYHDEWQSIIYTRNYVSRVIYQK